MVLILASYSMTKVLKGSSYLFARVAAWQTHCRLCHHSAAVNYSSNIHCYVVANIHVATAMQLATSEIVAFVLLAIF